MKFDALLGTNGSNPPRIEYNRQLLQGSGWLFDAPKPNETFVAPNEDSHDDEVTGFTREDYFAALEASAAELNEGLNKLEAEVPKDELEAWLDAFNKSE